VQHVGGMIVVTLLTKWGFEASCTCDLLSSPLLSFSVKTEAYVKDLMGTRSTVSTFQAEIM
jgi:hypothetical protein